jgi:hypothetical protein
MQLNREAIAQLLRKTERRLEIIRWILSRSME